ncbi:MAG: serine hydrolase [Bacteroidota bacterium]
MLRFGLLLLLLLSSACGTAQRAPLDTFVYPGDSWEHWESPEAAGFERDGLQAVETYLDSLPTFGALVVRGGRVVFEHGDTSSLFYVASVRKSILAMLYGRYVADGTIDLNRTLEDLGMDDVQGLTPAERQATVEHLITARSGVYHPASNAGDNLSDAPPRGSQAPGSYFLYSNWDFNAAGAAFENETGLNLYDALDTDLAQPLGFEDWTRAVQEKSGDLTRSRYPAYHMVISTRDLARLGLLMLREGKWEDEQVLPADWARRIVTLTTPRNEMNPAEQREMVFGYGTMWWVWDGPEATGPYEGAYSARGAYGQYITVLPALDLVVAHKTRPRPFGSMEEYARVSVSWEQFQVGLDRLVAAYCGSDCTPVPPSARPE